MAQIMIEGKIISIDGAINGRHYVELPDGLRLVYSNSGYEGYYDPNCGPTEKEELSTWYVCPDCGARIREDAVIQGEGVNYCPCCGNGYLGFDDGEDDDD